MDLRGSQVKPIVIVALLALVATQTAPVFQPVQPGLLSTGGSLANAWADFDGDGDLDLYVGFNGTPNRLYRNDAGALTDVAATAGVADARAVRAAAWGDYDSDGDSDLLVGFAPGTESLLRLYRNDGGRFTNVTDAAGIAIAAGAMRQQSWIDYDGDGDLDLFLAFRDRPNALYRNTAGKFIDIAADVGVADARKSVGAVWFDSDQDGYLDLHVANMDGDANGLFRYDGAKFTDVAREAGVDFGGRTPGLAANGTVRPCAADVNNDGRLDLFMANYGKNGLFLNRGGMRFEDVSEQWGIAIDARYDACAFSDFDNDGLLDLYVNGTVTGGTSYRDYLFRNTGSRYEDVTPENIRSLQADHGVQWADFDNDGDEDLALTGTRPDGMHSLMRNMLATAASQRSLSVRVLDSRGRAAMAGAEVRIFAAGSTPPLATRLVDSGSGYNSQNDAPVHFGVGNAQRVDVEAVFPRAGRRVSARATGISVQEFRGKVLTIRIPE